MNKPYFTRPKDNKPFPTEQYWTYFNAKIEMLKQRKRFLTIAETLFIQNNSKWDNVKKGILVTFLSANNKNKKIKIFFPAAGCRNHITGAFFNVGSHGDYWAAATSHDFASACYLFFRSEEIKPKSADYSVYSFPVRCVSDTKCSGSRQAHVMLDGKPIWIDLHNLKYKKHIKPYQCE